jgi:hypothetical protein
MVFVSCDGDAIGKLVGLARLTDDVARVRRVDAEIRAGNDAVTAWALGAGGSVIEAGGDETAVEVPAAAVAELETVRRRYAGITGATLSVGVGHKLSESSKALMAAKLRGRDRITVYDDSVEADIDSAKKDQSEAEKIGEEYLGKAESPAAPTDWSPHLADFHHAAGRQRDADTAKSKRRQVDVDALRSQVADALSKIRDQLPALQQVKADFPKTFSAVVGLAQSTLALARGIDSVDSSLSKAEALPRVYAAGDLRIPSSAHPDRAAWDARHQQMAAARWTNGVPLAAVQADSEPLDPGDHSTLDPRRVAMYREMLACGESLPPPVVDHDGRLLQGRHALAAYASSGVRNIPVLMRQLRATQQVEKAGDPGTAGVQSTPKPPGGHNHIPAAEPAHRGINLPVGSVAGGEVLVQHQTGKKSWRSVRSGLILGTDPVPGPIGAVSHPVSAIRPNST